MDLRSKKLSISLQKALVKNKKERNILEAEISKLNTNLDKKISKISLNGDNDLSNSSPNLLVRRRQSSVPIEIPQVVVNGPMRRCTITDSPGSNHFDSPSSKSPSLSRLRSVSMSPKMDSVRHFSSPRHSIQYDSPSNSSACGASPKSGFLDDSTSKAPHPPISPRNHRHSVCHSPHPPSSPRLRRESMGLNSSPSMDSPRKEKVSLPLLVPPPFLSMDSMESRRRSLSVQNLIARKESFPLSNINEDHSPIMPHSPRLGGRDNEEWRRNLELTRSLALGKKRTRENPRQRKRSSSLPDLATMMDELKDCRYLRNSSDEY